MLVTLNTKQERFRVVWALTVAFEGNALLRYAVLYFFFACSYEKTEALKTLP